GIIQGPEECEGTDLGGAACEDFPEYNGGTLACTPSCTFAFDGCTGPNSPGAWYGLDGSELAPHAVRTAGSASGLGVAVTGPGVGAAHRPDVAVDPDGRL